MGVPPNFDHVMFLALRIYTQILPSSGTATRPPRERPDGWDRWYCKESSLSQGFIKKCNINTPREFAEFANQINSVDCPFLEKSEIIQEPEKVSKATAILSTLKVHKVSRVRNGPHSFSNHFLKLSEDLEPFHAIKYGVQCGHSVNNINDESLCNNCYKRYILGEEWLKCPACCQWYHED